MSVSSSLGKLKRATKELDLQWSRVQESWHDQNARRFEQRILTPLAARLRRAELAMGQMAAVLQKARNDCG